MVMEPNFRYYQWGKHISEPPERPLGPWTHSRSSTQQWVSPLYRAHITMLTMGPTWIDQPCMIFHPLGQRLAPVCVTVSKWLSITISVCFDGHFNRMSEWKRKLSGPQRTLTVVLGLLPWGLVPAHFPGSMRWIAGVLPSLIVFFLQPVPMTVTSDGMSSLKVLKWDRNVCSKV